MRSFARSAVLISLTLLCLAAPLVAQRTKQPAAPAPKTPHGSVSGRVTIKDKPAPGVAVGLRKSDLSNPLEPFSRTTTGADGVYRIANVAAGVYQVGTAAPGFVGVERKDVVVGEDENVDGINFALIRGAAITGKVTDADERPVVQQQVEIYRAPVPQPATSPQQQPRPPQQMFPVMAGPTDDRGIYRLFGLPAGRYIVASGRGDAGFGGYTPANSSYKQVFHPDVADPAQATVVEVTEGGEAKDVDIKLGRSVQTFSVSGHVINSDSGLALPNNRFGLQRVGGQRAEFVATTLVTDPRGDFFVEGLIPGKYRVTNFANSGVELRPDPSGFEVIDQDLEDVVVKFSKGTVVTGVVIFEIQDKTALNKVNQLLLRGFIPSPNGITTSAASAIAADGSFRLAGLSGGQLNLSLNGTPDPYPPKGFSITRIERDGVVVPRIQLQDGEDVTGLKVFIAYGTAILRGVIEVENGKLPSNVRMYLQLTKSGENVSHFRGPQIDQRRHFFMEGIPAGDYELTAYITSPRRPPVPIKRPVTLTDGAITDITFTIDASTFDLPPPPPPPRPQPK